ncbi:replication initiation protein [Pseudovibrio japonicus]|uniref:Replication initiation protein n=1 Tax=Pseudovibrio japonicus TaxID=366534 RepID=A0ABQ3EID3_9HYPH|nr:plasmid replication protein RepC [Pseudovibrio japonicus]GHB41079.1 replication initiation protein [Pseudovibrio japonicus]
MQSTGVASFRKMTPAMLESQRLALANDIVKTTKAEVAITLKKAAPALGIDGTAYHILDILIGLTRADDWKQDRRPLVAISNDKLAEYVCRSTRTVIRAIKRLVEVGILAYRDSSTGRRFIYRNDASGEIDRGYGFDFSPARQRVEEIKRIGNEFQARVRAEQEAKRTVNRLSRAIIDACRTGQSEGADCEAFLTELNALMETPMLVVERSEKITKLYEVVVTELAEHSEEVAETPTYSNEYAQMSGDHDIDVTPYNITTHQTPKNSIQRQPSTDGYLNTKVASNEALEIALEKDQSSKFPAKSLKPTQGVAQQGSQLNAGLSDHLSAISIGLIDSATTETQDMLGMSFSSWFDLSQSAEQMRLAIGLSEDGWKQAILVLGEKMAAAVLVVTVEKTLRDPEGISRPAGYFRACVDRAKDGKLALHKSLYGLALA